MILKGADFMLNIVISILMLLFGILLLLPVLWIYVDFIKNVIGFFIDKRNKRS